LTYHCHLSWILICNQRNWGSEEEGENPEARGKGEKLEILYAQGKEHAERRKVQREQKGHRQ